MKKKNGYTLNNLIILTISMFLILSTASCEITQLLDLFNNQTNDNNNNNDDNTPPDIINNPEYCDSSICPGFTSISLGDTAPLDITGIHPKATQINWHVKNGPGGGTWNPSGQDQVIEDFTPDSAGMYNMEVSYQLGDFPCTCDFKMEVIDKPVVIVPLTIEWTTTQNGLMADGGWEIKENGRKIRFNVEDSRNCGGVNDMEQEGTAKATITVGENYTFIPEIVGIAELQDAGFEDMTVKLNGVTTVSATSNDLDKGCAMGPVDMSVVTPPPYILTPGTHTFELEFTTADPLYHVNSYYEVILTFQTR